jgi:DNA-binding winged helix-turn-helix (wHTH) protein
MPEGTENIPVAFQPGAQPGQAAGTQAQASTQEPVNDDLNQPVSKAEFLKAQDDLLRKVQGLVDKNISRVDKRVETATREAERVIETMKRNGFSITADQEMKLKSNAVQEALTETSAQTAAAPAQAQQQQPDEVAATNAAAAALFKAYGMVIEKDDPEAAQVNLSDPNSFIRSLTTALEKKATRLATPPQARTPDMGNNQPTNLQAKYQADLKNVQGNANALIELKKKYRALGLKV